MSHKSQTWQKANNQGRPIPIPRTTWSMQCRSRFCLLVSAARLAAIHTFVRSDIYYLAYGFTVLC